MELGRFQQEVGQGKGHEQKRGADPVTRLQVEKYPGGKGDDAGDEDDVGDDGTY